MFEKLYVHLEGKININQYGGIRSGSTAHYLTKLNHFMLKALEQTGNILIITFIDMKKGFDLVDHSVLAYILMKYEVPHSDILWILNFLSNRSQVVKNGKNMSDSDYVTCGTPAGTKLAPLLFVLLINEILESVEVEFIKNNPNVLECGFIDDLTIVECVNSKENPQTQNFLDFIGKISNSIKMVINSEKCELFIVDPSRQKISNLWNFKILGKSVPKITSATLLGVKFNNKLKWDDQVNNMCNKANRKLFIINKIRQSGFDQKEQIRAYLTYIRPNLEYCSVVWGAGLNDKLSSKIERVQKRALSIILRKKVDRNNYDEIMEELKIASLSIRRELALSKFGRKLFMSKRFRNFLPQLVDSSSQRKLRNRKEIMHQPCYKNERYRLSTLPAIINDINHEYIEKGTLFGWKVEDALIVEGII